MMKCNLFLGFKNGCLETLILSKAIDEENAIDCDYYVTVDDPNHVKKNVLMWLDDREEVGK